MTKKRINKKNKSNSNNYRLVVLNDSNYLEKFSLKLNKINVIFFLSLTALILIVLTASIIFFTPVKEYIPGYDTKEIRQKALQNIKSLDSLTSSLELYKQYVLSLKSTIYGEEYNSKYQPSKNIVKVDLSELEKPVNIQDSILRRLVEREDKFNIIETKDYDLNFYLQSPVRGIIVEKFNISDKHFGVDIALKEKTPIKAIADGIIMFSENTISTGHTILLFHKNNIFSIYKHNHSSPLKKGDFVKSGQLIAFSGNSGEHTTGPHLHFEIWDNKGPINPEDIIVF
jgi:murein DD-endopeptidase MepM/ murein hydrolase activator NlpD